MAYWETSTAKTIYTAEALRQVYFDQMNPRTFTLSASFSAPGGAQERKHPSVDANSRGQVLLAGTVGTAWSKGGSLAWQLYDQAGKPVRAEGHADGVPVWGLPSAVPERDGNLILYGSLRDAPVMSALFLPRPAQGDGQNCQESVSIR